MHIPPTTSSEQKARLVELHGNPFAAPLSPRERVATAINRQTPDQVPFDFWGVPEIIEKLIAYLEIHNESELYDLLGIDCRIVWPEYIGPEMEQLPDGSFYNPWGSHRKLVSNSFSTYEEYASFPLAFAQNASDVEKWDKWPHAEYWNWQKVPQQIKEFNQNIPHHIRYEVGGIFEFAWGVYGLEKFLMDLIQNPEVPCAILDQYTDIFIDNIKHLMETAGNEIDMLYTYDDVATQNGLMMSPKMWHQYILPRHKRLNAFIKEYDVKIMHHCCGAVYDLIQPYIDEMHIDVLNPLQPRAKNMDMERIKKEFGDKLAFHGGIDLQYTLPYGTPQEVEEEVLSRCAILGKGGGYICTSAHYIQADVPPQNIVTMYSTSREVTP